MPNHTTNILSIYCEDEDKMQEIRKIVLGEDKLFDFNLIVPMPEELSVVSGSIGDEAYTCLYGTDEEVARYLEYPWVKEAGVTNREELTEFLEKRSDKNKNDDEMSWRELGNRYASNLKKYGAKTWYDWCCSNWGTKWNAYEEQEVLYDEDDRIDVRFTTAWSPPVPVYEKLQEMFEDAEIEAFWSDEGAYERQRVFP
jgi:hypothetical protein